MHSNGFYTEDTVTKLFFSLEYRMLSYKMFTQIQAFNCPWFLQVVYRLFFFTIIINMQKKVVSDNPRLLNFTAVGQVDTVIFFPQRAHKAVFWYILKDKNNRFGEKLFRSGENNIVFFELR